MPPDFNFSLSFGDFGDQISTFDSTYKRALTVDDSHYPGDTAVKVLFTKEEMQYIYQTLIKYNYLNIPDTIIVSASVRPYASSLLAVVVNSKKKTIYSIENSPSNGYLDVFDSIQSCILKIAFSKKEIRNLPPDTRHIE